MRKFEINQKKTKKNKKINIKHNFAEILVSGKNYSKILYSVSNKTILKFSEAIANEIGNLLLNSILLRKHFH